ncbi:MAG: PD40 domain-containing protein [Candidatus Marinimicrobia bacterium]|nr:PD40 domain-containing protein [Candidatus Neomarinimicrobiota bacterium]
MTKQLHSLFGILPVWLFVLTNPLESQLSSLQHEPHLNWRVLHTQHFLIYYPTEFEELGHKIATICEEVYEPISRSLNYYPSRTHVIVHTRIDFSDAIVSFLPWQIELFVTEPQGNIIGSGDLWLKVLIAHEFTHIVHLRKHKGLSTLTYPLLGNFNALWQLSGPMWFSEGVATLNESRYSSGGRGRTPFHWMQMAAPIRAGRPWRLENTNYRSRRRMPQKHMKYISGYYLSYYVSEQYGSDVWTKILDRYTAFPLFGFGRAVKSVTGKSMKQIYNEMLDRFDTQGINRDSFAPPEQIWRMPKNPEDQHSPRWVDQDHLMIYRKSFDDLPELTLIDRSGRSQKIRERRLAKIDNSFTIGKKVLVWAELHPHSRFSATIFSDLKFYDQRTGKVRALTHNARLYSPDLSPDETRVVAIQTALPTTRLVTVSLKNGEISSVLEIPYTTILNPRWSPDGEWIAFALKDSTGQQDIAIVEVRTGRWRYLYPPDIPHDNNPCWTPDSRYVLYTSDLSGIFNIWAVEVTTGKRWMVSDSEFGAFTPDVSPYGDELAFKNYTYTGFIAVTILLDSTRWLEKSSVQSYKNPLKFSARDTANLIFDQPSIIPSKITAYQPWKQILVPQGWIPFPFEDENGGAVALFAISQDVLHRNIWQGSFGLSPKTLRTTVDFSYTYRGWWPELNVRAYSLPVRVSDGNATGWWRKRGIEITASLPLVLESNAYETFFQPVFRLKHHTKSRSTGTIYPKLKNYRGVQLGFDFGRTGQAPRDIVPHRAWFITAFADWSSPTLGSEFNGQQFSSRLNVFLPTAIQHHQIEFLGKYQNRR